MKNKVVPLFKYELTQRVKGAIGEKIYDMDMRIRSLNSAW